MGGRVTDTPNKSDDPAVVGVPPETPEDIRPSATGLVAGPVDGETDVQVADVGVPSEDPAEPSDDRRPPPDDH